MIPGGGRRHIGHMDTDWLIAEATARHKRLHVRATAGPSGRLVWVLDVGRDMELTADYRSAS